MTKTAPPRPPRARKPRRPKQTLFKLRQEAGTDPDRAKAYEAAVRSKYRYVFDTLDGREVLADFFARIGVFAADEAHAGDVANHRNGARWAGFELLRAMGVDDADAMVRVVLNDDVSEVFNEE